MTVRFLTFCSCVYICGFLFSFLFFFCYFDDTGGQDIKENPRALPGSDECSVFYFFHLPRDCLLIGIALDFPVFLFFPPSYFSPHRTTLL